MPLAQAGGGVSVPSGSESLEAARFPFLEGRLVEVTGLAKALFQRFREKTRAKHVWKLCSGSVAYSRLGAEMALSYLGIAAEEQASILQKSGADAAGNPSAIEAKVFRFCPSRRALKCKRLDDGTLVHVVMERPKAREDLSIGQVIPIWPSQRPDQFECRLR